MAPRMLRTSEQALRLREAAAAGGRRCERHPQDRATADFKYRGTRR